MTFLAAGWLTLFAPLAAIAWLVCRRAAEPATTTAAWLWRDDGLSTMRPDVRRARPPLWILATLAAAACVIAALAGPTSALRHATIAVVIDPAAHLQNGGSASPMAAMLARVGAASDAATWRVVVPGQPDARSPGDVRPTARATDDTVRATVAWLAREQNAIVVLTDAPDVDAGPRGIVLRPSDRASAARVTRIAARDIGSATAVLARVERDPAGARLEALSLRSGAAVASQAIDWSAGGTVADVSLTLQSTGDRIQAALDGNVAARLARTGAPAIRIARQGPLPAFAERFATIYARERPADATATTVTLTTDVVASGPRVIVAGGDALPASAGRGVEHEVIERIDLADLRAITASPPADFRPIAWSGERTIVAVHDVPGGRAVWVGIDASRPAPALVALLDSAVHWASGEPSESWSSVTSEDVPGVGWTPVDVDDASVEASPGFYRDADGKPRAVNAGAARSLVADGKPSADALAAFVRAAPFTVARDAGRAPASLASGFAALASICAAFAARGGRPS